MRHRVVLLAVVAVLVVAACVTYGRHQYAEAQARATRAPSVPVATQTAQPAAGAAPASGPRIVFRHTGLDAEYGVVASVPLDQPAGARTFTDTACDRVDAAPDGSMSCLATERGVVTKFEAHDVDPSGAVRETVDLPGVPSRTRFSPDGSLVATTSFVTGHSYLSVGFSTATVVRRLDGASFGDLERFALFLDGARVNPTDRNVWGVTFVDDRAFYATVGTGGKTYLVRGDLDARTLTSVATGVECPSLSPDGTRIAFKQVTSTEGGTTWTPAVLDLATGARTVLDGETRSIDDQIEWLDDGTILYGMPRDDQPGVTDVWSLATAPGAAPELFIEQAWSPSVVR